MPDKALVQVVHVGPREPSLFPVRARWDFEQLPAALGQDGAVPLAHGPAVGLGQDPLLLTLWQASRSSAFFRRDQRKPLDSTTKVSSRRRWEPRCCMQLGSYVASGVMLESAAKCGAIPFVDLWLKRSQSLPSQGYRSHGWKSQPRLSGSRSVTRNTSGKVRNATVEFLAV